MGYIALLKHGHIMKNRLIFIGNSFKQNHAFRAYITRNIIQAIGFIETQEFFFHNDLTLLDELQKRILSEENIFLVSDKKSFTFVSKLLCSLSDDKLVLKEQILVPSKSIVETTSSYLLEINRAKINVLEAQESQKFPVLLIHNEVKTETLHFFEEHIKDVIAKLTPLSKQYSVELSFTQIVEGWVEVKVNALSHGAVDKFLHLSQEQFENKVIIAERVIEHIITTLKAQDLKLTLAESCTGGLLAYYFTSQAGVSSIFEGSLVTYSNILKEKWLAVEQQTLIDHGAVSQEVVTEMLIGSKSVANAHFSLAISGVAGPDGGTLEKPVGTVVIGASSSQGENVVTYHFNGDRQYIQEQSALTALKMLVLSDKKVFFTN